MNERRRIRDGRRIAWRAGLALAALAAWAGGGAMGQGLAGRRDPPHVAGAPAARPDAAVQARAAEALGAAPAPFVENRGQWADADVRFALSGRGVNVGLTREGLRFQLFRRAAAASSPAAAPAAEGRAPGRRPDTSPRAAEAGAGAGSASVAPRMMEFAVRFEEARAVAPVGGARSGQTFNFRRGPAA